MRHTNTAARHWFPHVTIEPQWKWALAPPDPSHPTTPQQSKAVSDVMSEPKVLWIDPQTTSVVIDSERGLIVRVTTSLVWAEHPAKHPIAITGFLLRNLITGEEQLNKPNAPPILYHCDQLRCSYFTIGLEGILGKG